MVNQGLSRRRRRGNSRPASRAAPCSRIPRICYASGGRAWSVATARLARRTRPMPEAKDVGQGEDSRPSPPPSARRPLLRGFRRGPEFTHRLTRTVTQMEQHAVLEHDAQSAAPPHRCAFLRTETEWGRPIVNSLFTLGLMIGISVQRHDGRHHHRQFGMTDVRFPAPVFERRFAALRDHHPVEARLEVAPDRRPRRDASRAYKQDGRWLPSASVRPSC